MKRLARRLFPAGLFLLAFLPRLLYPVSRPLVWYVRSVRFADAVAHANWPRTVFSEHPGVTVMWLSGSVLHAYYALVGQVPAALEAGPLSFRGPVSHFEIQLGVAPLALATSLAILLAYGLLRELLDRRTAAIACILMALDPFHLANSKVLHPDALLASLILLSLLALLVYLKRGRRSRLVLSGALAGLATLTKAPALSLVPFSLGAMGLVGLIRLLQQPAERRRGRRWLELLGRTMGAWVLWLAVLVVVFFLAWPAMWTSPQRALREIYEGVALHSANPHDSATFYRGDITLDPGPTFYPTVWLFKSTAVTLLFGGLGAVLVAGRGRWRHRYGLSLFLLALFAALFLVGMSLSPKKINRYALPALAITDLFAAVGLIGWSRLLLPQARQRRWQAALIGIPVLAQALIVLPRHPYYGTHYNWLAGGPPAAAAVFPLQDEGEGLDLAAQLMNQQPDASRLTAATHMETAFLQHFDGTTLPIAAAPTDHVVFARNDVVRQRRVFDWNRAWNQYAPRAPEQTISFDGLPYVWVYRGLPEEPTPQQVQTEMAVRLGEGIHLIGYDLEGTSFHSGETIRFQLYWQAEAAIEGDHSVFVHLTDASGNLLAQDDGPPTGGNRPTSSWQAGELILDRRDLALSPNVPPGDYVVSIGMYTLATLERLPAYGEDSQRLPEDRIDLAEIRVERPEPIPIQHLARGLAAVALLLPAAYALLRRQKASTPNGESVHPE